MRMRKLRGPHMKKSMPFEPFRTHTQPVNLVRPEPLRRRRRGDAGRRCASAASRRASGVPVKILARGELERKNLVVSAHGFSAKAREEIEGAGGTCTVVEPRARRRAE